MYELATQEPYSFWHIHLAARRREDMFYLRFEKRMIPTSGKGQDQQDGSIAPNADQGHAFGAEPHDSDTEVEVLAPILCCSTVTVDESDHTNKEEHEHRSGVGR